MMPLVGAGATVAACYGLGALLLDWWGIRLDRYERLPLGFLLGAAGLHLVIFALLALKIAYWPVVVGCLLLFLAGCRTGAGFPSIRKIQALLFLPFVVLAFFHAWAPESSPDGAGYHLGLVARYIRAHGFERVTTSMYANLGGGVETLFVPAFMIGRHSAAALVHFAFAIALALTMLAYGRRIGKPWAGGAAAFLTFASPVVGIDGSSAYNDVALAAVVFAAFYWLQIWDDARADVLLIPVGLLCGYAYAIKYTGVVILLLALVFVAYRSRRSKGLLVMISCALTMMAPWMIKDWVYVHNPVSPVANRIFRNPYIHIAAEDVWNQNVRRYEVENKWTLPIEVTVRGEKTEGLIGPVFLLAPLAFLALREQAGRRLLAAGIVLLATYFANVGTRFLIPCLPFFSLAMALPLANAPALLGALMLFHAVTSWPAVMDLYSPQSWRLGRILYEEALRIVPEDTYLRQIFPPYGAAKIIDAHVPEGERVLAMSAGADAYTSREILVGYQAAFNQDLEDSVDMGWLQASQPRVLETFSFPEKTVRHVRLLQTGAGDPASLEQWSVHELRFFDHGTELPRRAEWRVGASPNPGDAWLAFDNSPATRWRTWETAHPGNYVDVDFGRPECIDQVKLDTSYDYNLHRQVVVEVKNDEGWVRIASNRVISVLDPGPQIRRAGTKSMLDRGVHYLLMGDGDFGAKEMDEDPAGWGLKALAAGYGVKLYQVIP